MIAGVKNPQKLAECGGSPHQGHAEGPVRRPARPADRTSPVPAPIVSGSIRRRRRRDRQADRRGSWAPRSRRWTRRCRPVRPPFDPLIALLLTIPGVSALSATTILAEIGTDMSRFPTAGHLLAWAGLCPSQNESAGKRKSSRLRKGAPWLKTMLVQCAWAAKRKKDSYYKAQFNRLRGKRGPKVAICAVAASLLTAIFHMLKDGPAHQDLGAGYFDQPLAGSQSQASGRPSSPGSASRCNSNRSPKPPDGCAELSPREMSPIAAIRASRAGGFLLGASDAAISGQLCACYCDRDRRVAPLLAMTAFLASVLAMTALPECTRVI